MGMESSGLRPEKRKKKGDIMEKVYRTLVAGNVFLGGVAAGSAMHEPLKKVVDEKKMEYRITEAAKNFKQPEFEKNFKMADKYKNLPASENIQDLRGEALPYKSDVARKFAENEDPNSGLDITFTPDK